MAVFGNLMHDKGALFTVCHNPPQVLVREIGILMISLNIKRGNGGARGVVHHHRTATHTVIEWLRGTKYLITKLFIRYNSTASDSSEVKVNFSCMCVCVCSCLSVRRNFYFDWFGYLHLYGEEVIVGETHT